MALGGFFSRLKEGLSRSTQKLSGGITAVFKKRRLDDEALEELQEECWRAAGDPLEATRSASLAWVSWRYRRARWPAGR